MDESDLGTIRDRRRLSTAFLPGPISASIFLQPVRRVFVEWHLRQRQHVRRSWVGGDREAGPFTPNDDHRGCRPTVSGRRQLWFLAKASLDRQAHRKKRVDRRTPFQRYSALPGQRFWRGGRPEFDIVTPICSEGIIRRRGSSLDQRSSWWLTVMGRLKPGSSIQQAEAAMKALRACCSERPQRPTTGHRSS